MSLTNPNNPKQQLLSIPQVARLAGIVKMTAYNWIEREEIPTYQLGKRRYVTATTAAFELGLTGLPLLTDLRQAVTDTSGGLADLSDLARAYVLDARGQMPRITLPNGTVYYTTFGVARALKMPNRVYLGIGEAAEQLQLHPDTIRRRILRGELKTIRKLGTEDVLVLASSADLCDTQGWVRSADVAGQWRVSQSAVNRLCHQGKLRAVLKGGRNGYYLIDPTDIPTPPRDPITTAQLAALTGIPASTIENWRNKGLVRCARLGHDWRYPRNEVRRLRRQHQRSNRA